MTYPTDAPDSSPIRGSRTSEPRSDFRPTPARPIERRQGRPWGVRPPAECRTARSVLCDKRHPGRQANPLPGQALRSDEPPHRPETDSPPGRVFILSTPVAGSADPYRLATMEHALAPARITTVEMLARLVSFDTTSRNSNLPLIAFVRDYLDAHGVPYRLSTNPGGDKANIHAIIGPQQAGTVSTWTGT